MKTSIGKFMLVMAIGVAFLVSGSPAFAEEPSKKVMYGDLDLGQPADVSLLYERIRKAARLVCSDRLFPSLHRCIAAAVEQAVRDVNDVALTAVHEGNNRTVASR
jgi:UrcA family protein